MSHLVTLCGRQLEQPGHICAFFDSRVEQYDVLTPYYKEGIDAGEQVVTIVDGADVHSHCNHIEQRGVDVQAAIGSQAFKVLSAEETYTSGGRFAADRMYDLLQNALAQGKKAGKRVRTSGVMDWASRGHPGTEELMDYEARVNVLVPTYDCTLLCVYDLAKVTGQEVMDILATHPFVIHRRQIKENPHYVPPIEMLREVLFAGTKQSAEQLEQA